jgi:hypothetical protein
MVGISEVHDVLPAARLGMRTVRIGIEELALVDGAAHAIAASQDEVKDDPTEMDGRAIRSVVPCQKRSSSSAPAVRDREPPARLPCKWCGDQRIHGLATEQTLERPPVR